MTQNVSRRGMIGGCVVASVATSVATSVAVSLPALGAVSDGAYDPRNSAEGQVKLSATLDESPAFWVYSGVVYAVQPETRPLPILAVSGCESHWAKAEADASYRVSGTTLSFFRDLNSAAFLEQFDNPITGKCNLVKPNLLSGGSAVYPADGSSARAEGKVKDAVIAPKGFHEADPKRALGAVRWSIIGPSIMLMTDRSWNVAVQPQLEAQTQSADRAAFFDRTIRKLPARYTATTIIPWMTWMEMGTAPGHLVWHTSGEKIFTLDGVPADYRAKAGDLMDKLASRPAKQA